MFTNPEFEAAQAARVAAAQAQRQLAEKMHAASAEKMAALEAQRVQRAAEQAAQKQERDAMHAAAQARREAFARGEIGPVDVASIPRLSGAIEAQRAAARDQAREQARVARAAADQSPIPMNDFTMRNLPRNDPKAIEYRRRWMNGEL